MTVHLTKSIWSILRISDWNGLDPLIYISSRIVFHWICAHTTTVQKFIQAISGAQLNTKYRPATYPGFSHARSLLVAITNFFFVLHLSLSDKPTICQPLHVFSPGFGPRTLSSSPDEGECPTVWFVQPQGIGTSKLRNLRLADLFIQGD